MSEEENAVVDQQDQAYAEPEASNDSHEEVSNKSENSEQSVRNDAEKNWAEMRRAMREKDRKIDELERRFAEFSNPKQKESDEDKDDLMTRADLDRYWEKKEQKRLAEEAEDRVRLRHRDFDDVFTKENIELFLEQERELAETLQYISDPYKQAETAYKMLKKFGKSTDAIHDRKKAEANSKKPVSVQAVTKSSAIGDAHRFENGLTKELKKSLYEEMQKAMKYG